MHLFTIEKHMPDVNVKKLWEALHVLLNAGADPTVQDNAGTTLLDRAMAPDVWMPRDGTVETALRLNEADVWKGRLADAVVEDVRVAIARYAEKKQ
jgi:hypothetical protein